MVLAQTPVQKLSLFGHQMLFQGSRMDFVLCCVMKRASSLNKSCLQKTECKMSSFPHVASGLTDSMLKPYWIVDILCLHIDLKVVAPCTQLVNKEDYVK